MWREEVPARWEGRKSAMMCSVLPLEAQCFDEIPVQQPGAVTRFLYSPLSVSEKRHCWKASRRTGGCSRCSAQARKSPPFFLSGKGRCRQERSHSPRPPALLTTLATGRWQLSFPSMCLLNTLRSSPSSEEAARAPTVENRWHESGGYAAGFRTHG